MVLIPAKLFTLTSFTWETGKESTLSNLPLDRNYPPLSFFFFPLKTNYIQHPQHICLLSALHIQYSFPGPWSSYFPSMMWQPFPGKWTLSFFKVYGNLKEDVFFTLKEFLSNIVKTHPPAVNVVLVTGDTWGISPTNTFKLFTIYRATAIFQGKRSELAQYYWNPPRWGESSSSLRLHVNNYLMIIIIFTGVSVISYRFIFHIHVPHILDVRRKKKKRTNTKRQDDLFPEQLCSKPVKWKLFQSNCAKRDTSQISHYKLPFTESNQPTLNTFRVSGPY